ncbi:transposase, MuDR [Artemisia annua]|uniref:Transposase, MuDR n=1 Tax=Artemisia annua TaxID=35608 RepID=A0A2U1KSE6_ARTAN|nr:transposase, MuDR [Artemisia annua]
MLCEWRVRKKGSASNLYHDYRKFPTVFCLKINHGGAFTSPPKVRYKGGKVNWIDTIDSERFSVVEVATMMQELGYENGSSDVTTTLVAFGDDACRLQKLNVSSLNAQYVIQSSETNAFIFDEVGSSHNIDSAYTEHHFLN